MLYFVNNLVRFEKYTKHKLYRRKNVRVAAKVVMVQNRIKGCSPGYPGPPQEKGSLA